MVSTETSLHYSRIVSLGNDLVYDHIRYTRQLVVSYWLVEHFRSLTVGHGEGLASAPVLRRYKRHWITEEMETGTAAAFYDLITDTRELFPKLIPLIWTSGQFDRMLARHVIWKEKYPDKEKTRGVPYTGIENARPETQAIGDTLEQLRKELPFDPLEFIQFHMPDELRVSSRTDGVD